MLRLLCPADEGRKDRIIADAPLRNKSQFSSSKIIVIIVVLLKIDNINYSPLHRRIPDDTVTYLNRDTKYESHSEEYYAADQIGGGHKNRLIEKCPAVINSEITL